MTATPGDRVSRWAAFRHAVDVLRLCVTGRARPAVLGYASAGTGRRRRAKWATFRGALGDLLRRK